LIHAPEGIQLSDRDSPSYINAKKTHHTVHELSPKIARDHTHKLLHTEFDQIDQMYDSRNECVNFVDNALKSGILQAVWTEWMQTTFTS
jgi:hypothetical protein